MSGFFKKKRTPKTSSPELQRSYTTTSRSSTYDSALPRHAIAPRLPPGWEKDVNDFGQTYYLDHNTRRTTWYHPDAIWKDVGPLPMGWQVQFDGYDAAYFVKYYDEEKYIIPVGPGYENRARAVKEMLEMEDGWNEAEMKGGGKPKSDPKSKAETTPRSSSGDVKSNASSPSASRTTSQGETPTRAALFFDELTKRNVYPNMYSSTSLNSSTASIDGTVNGSTNKHVLSEPKPVDFPLQLQRQYGYFELEEHPW